MVHPSHDMRSISDVPWMCMKCYNCSCHAPNAAMLMIPCRNEKKKKESKEMLGVSEIENRFGFHKGTIEGPNATTPKHAELRRQFVNFARMLDEVLPEGRAKSLAVTQLEDSSMWAHKAIAQNAPLVSDEPENIAHEVPENWPAPTRGWGADRPADPNVEEAQVEEKGL